MTWEVAFEERRFFWLKTRWVAYTNMLDKTAVELAKLGWMIRWCKASHVNMVECQALVAFVSSESTTTRFPFP